MPPRANLFIPITSEMDITELRNGRSNCRWRATAVVCERACAADSGRTKVGPGGGTGHMAERRAWWNSPVAIALAIILATVPLLYPRIPPLIDLLGHMGRYRVELDGGHSPWLQQYYAFHWAPIGNL